MLDGHISAKRRRGCEWNRSDGLLGLEFSLRDSGVRSHRSDGLNGLGFIIQVGEIGGHKSDGGFSGLGFIFVFVT